MARSRSRWSSGSTAPTTSATSTASTRSTTRSAGVVVTGNEDGAHAAAETTLFNLSHLGFAIPPNADTYWVGEAGPGPSFIEAGGGDHPYTQRTTRWMAHNTVHLARILKAHPIPPEGNTFDEEEQHQPHLG